jgi:hypothetical protein
MRRSDGGHGVYAGVLIFRRPAGAGTREARSEDADEAPEPDHASRFRCPIWHGGPAEDKGGINGLKTLRKMAGAAGLEPATCGFGDRRSTN